MKKLPDEILNHLQPLPEKSQKLFPIGMIGSGFDSESAHAFPWRSSVADKVLQIFPCFSYDTPNDTADIELRKMRQRCRLCLFCGGSEQKFRREFLEIMLDESCLITQRSPVLLELGFLDGINCVFVDPDDVTKKCASLLEDDERLKSIIASGESLARQILADCE